MDKIIGFIGYGNMAQAICRGIIKRKIVDPIQVYVSNRSIEKLENELLPINKTTDNCLVAKAADFLFIAVKPDVYPRVVEEIKDSVKEDVIIINIAAGITLEKLQNWFNKEIKILKAMPNTPALVGEAMTAICPNPLINESELHELIKLLSAIGQVEIVSEALMDAVTAVSGSAPAYVFMFIEAMADQAVVFGMRREQAYKFASQTLLGAAKMVLETGKHPGELKDQVCSPGGTTIEAVIELEKAGLRQAVQRGMSACFEKSLKMTKNE